MRFIVVFALLFACTSEAPGPDASATYSGISPNQLCEEQGISAVESSLIQNPEEGLILECIGEAGAYFIDARAGNRSTRTKTLMSD